MTLDLDSFVLGILLGALVTMLIFVLCLEEVQHDKNTPPKNHP